MGIGPLVELGVNLLSRPLSPATIGQVLRVTKEAKAADRVELDGRVLTKHCNQRMALVAHFKRDASPVHTASTPNEVFQGHELVCVNLDCLYHYPNSTDM